MRLDIEPRASEAQLIPKSATPIETKSGGPQRVRLSFFRTIGVWLGLVRDYTAEDIGRLKEAGVQMVEGEARRANADAALKLAEAAERQAKADLTRAQIEKVRADATVALINSKGEYVERVAKAVERVSNAICVIKQKGGAVSFDEKELLDLLKRGLKEFPDDLMLTDANQKNPDDCGE